jgi:hypothetical protein
MRQKRPDINMTLRYPAFSQARVVNDRNQSIPIVANVEDDISIHAIRILEDMPDLHKIAPSRVAGDFEPGPYLLCNLGELLLGLGEVFASYNVHRSLRVSRNVRQAAPLNVSQVYFAKCKVVKELDSAFCKAAYTIARSFTVRY